MDTTESELYDRLSEVIDPVLEEDIVSLSLINEISIEDDVASISLAFNSPYAPAEMDIGNQIRSVVSDAGLEPQLSADVGAEHGFDEQVLPSVRNVVAVASGKGGVGKTTVAANLAAGLDELGARVGLLDADIHGPNVPRLLPTEQEPGVTPDTEKLVPPEGYGVKVMSMSYLVRNPDDPAIMRGPMVNKVMTHFLENVEWGALDYLVVDLPPGTGDASLNLLQSMPLTGVVIVSTPQQMALDDARKGLRLFEKHEAPVIGIVENMSTFVCPTCDDEHELFAGAGVDAICDDYDVSKLGVIPMHHDFGADGSGGPVVKDEDSDVRSDTMAFVEETADGVGGINRRRVAEYGSIESEQTPDA